MRDNLEDLKTATVLLLLLFVIGEAVGVSIITQERDTARAALAAKLAKLAEPKDACDSFDIPQVITQPPPPVGCHPTDCPRQCGPVVEEP